MQRDRAAYLSEDAKSIVVELTIADVRDGYVSIPLAVIDDVLLAHYQKSNGVPPSAGMIP